MIVADSQTSVFPILRGADNSEGVRAEGEGKRGRRLRVRGAEAAGLPSERAF